MSDIMYHLEHMFTIVLKCLRPTLLVLVHMSLEYMHG